MGYAQAGFEVTGIDLKKGKRYPFDYIQGNVMTLNPEDLMPFDFIHSSPPCQTYSITRNLRIAQGKQSSKLDLIEPVRELLKRSGKPYVIENVEGSRRYLKNPLMLCGNWSCFAICLTGWACMYNIKLACVFC